MLAAARQAAGLAQRSSGLLQQTVLPALTFQVTSLTSLTAMGCSSSRGEQSRHRGGAALSGSCSGSGLLLLHGQQLVAQQQQRPIFNFAGFSGDLSKSHHEKKLLG